MQSPRFDVDHACHAKWRILKDKAAIRHVVQHMRDCIGCHVPKPIRKENSRSWFRIWPALLGKTHGCMTQGKELSCMQRESVSSRPVQTCLEASGAQAQQVRLAYQICFDIRTLISKMSCMAASLLTAAYKQAVGKAVQLRHLLWLFYKRDAALVAMMPCPCIAKPAW